MKTYRLNFVTNSGKQYASEPFQTDALSPEEAFGKFAAKYGVPESGMAFPCTFPKKCFVFVPTQAMSSIEIMEINCA